MRSVCEVLTDHLQLANEHRWQEDLDRNFADDCVLLTGYGVFRGRKGMREKIALLDKHLPNGRYTYKNILCDGEMGFLEWSGEGDGAVVRDGADSYLVRDGKIRVMTIHYTVEPAGASRATSS